MYEADEQEVEAVKRVILGRRLFRYRPDCQGECDQFEGEFAHHFGIDHAIILSSGTNALVAALAAVGVGPGDEVLVPAYTFVATAAAVRMVGANPVIVNIDEKLGLSAADARRRVTPRTKAVIPVHMDGLAADMDGILALAKENRLHVIEDCAQALGGSFHGRRLGSLGSVGAFSLNENKNISCGEGGVVVTADRILYEKLFCIHDTSAYFNPNKKALFQHVPPFVGMSMRVSEVQGAMMRVQLRRLESILARLRERKAILMGSLNGLSCCKVIVSHCPAGDCGSTLHLLFGDPGIAALARKALLEKKLDFHFPSLRPAHVAWKWLHLFGPESEKQKSELLPSINTAMCTLRMDVDIHLSVKQTTELGLQIREALQPRVG